MDSQMDSDSEARPVDTYTQAQSSLFRLPLEVRQQIYRLLLAFTWDKFIMTHITGWHSFPFINDGPNCQPLPAPMLACKRLYHDLAPQALGEATISLFMLRRAYGRGAFPTFLVGKAAYGRLRLSRLRKLVVITNSRHNVEWGHLGWGASLAHILKGASSLHEVVLEMYAVPVAITDLQKWLEVQTDTLLPSLQQLNNLELVRFRTNVPASYRGIVPNMLSEAIRQETGATVFETELEDRWAASVWSSDDEFLLRPRGRDSWGYHKQKHPTTRIVTLMHASKKAKASLGYRLFRVMCQGCHERQDKGLSSKDCCWNPWSIEND